MHQSPAKTRSGRSRDYRDVIVFKKLSFQNVFCPAHENVKQGFHIPPVLRAFSFYGLAWTVGLTGER